MNDAAKAARGAFADINDSAQSMGDGVSDASGRVEYSMGEARHSVMMLGESVGVHLPRGITTFIASLGPIGPALEMAFPFLAIILGATLLIEHLTKLGEAAAKAAEEGVKFGDDMTLGVNKAKEGYIDAEIEARKLADLPAWDLLAEKLKLKTADEGIENVRRLEKELDELVKTKATASSNWNPFNWLDHSDDIKNKVASISEALHGKDTNEQQSVLQNTLGIQSKVLADMEKQGDASTKQLDNQREYVNWLKQATDEITFQNAKSGQDAANKQTVDRQAKIREAEEEQNKLYETQQRGANHRLQVEAEYSKKQSEIAKKRMEDNERLAEEESKATEVVVKAAEDAAKEKARIDAEEGKEEAEHAKKMAQLNQQTEEEITKDAVKLHKSRSEAILAAEIAGENAVFNADMHGYQAELAALDKFGKDYQVKLKQIQDREAELEKEHQNKLTQISLQAEQERDQRLLSARQHADDMIASSMTKVLEGQEKAGKALIGIGREVAGGMMENAIKSVLANNFTKESDAAAAARKAYLAGMHFPFPVNVVMGPLLGAAAFASVMAFDAGAIVPGNGGRDSVPTMLTPGEAVLPKRLTEGLTDAAKNGSLGGGSQGDVHFHYNPTQHFNALDQSGMSDVLDKHADVIEQHVNNAFKRKGM